MRTRTIWDAQEQAAYLNRIGDGTFARRERRRRQIRMFTVELWRRMDERDALVVNRATPFTAEFVDSLRLFAKFLKRERFADFDPGVPISEIVPKYGPHGGAR